MTTTKKEENRFEATKHKKFLKEELKKDKTAKKNEEIKPKSRSGIIS
jgi:hypothetical protein